MKKIFAVLICLVFVISLFSIGTSAASALNANEQAVLNALSTRYEIGKTSYSIPTEYVLQARNYFLTINLSKEQADRIISYINKAMSKVQSVTKPTAAFSIGKLPRSTKESILKDAQNACSVVGCKLTYNVSKKTVTIKNAKGSEIFTSAPIIKRTGASVFPAAVFFAAAAAFMAISATIIKKVRLCK